MKSTPKHVEHKLENQRQRLSRYYNGLHFSMGYVAIQNVEEEFKIIYKYKELCRSAATSRHTCDWSRHAEISTLLHHHSDTHEVLDHSMK